MNLGQFIERFKLQVPNIGQTGVTDGYLTTLANSAVNEVNLRCKMYSGYTDFDIEANKAVYELSLIAPTFLGRDKRGLFFKNSSDAWEDIIPKTEPWISETYPDYLNSSAIEIPDYYYIIGNNLGFYPAPTTSKTAGARLYHLKKAGVMTDASHYPFSGTTTEIGAFLSADDAIISYVKWKLAPAYGQNTDQDLLFREFSLECQRASLQIRRSPDMSHDATYGLKT